MPRGAGGESEEFGPQVLREYAFLGDGERGIIECREALAFPGEPDRAVVLRRIIAAESDATGEPIPATTGEENEPITTGPDNPP
jgi:hypothetical protein